MHLARIQIPNDKGYKDATASEPFHKKRNKGAIKRKQADEVAQLPARIFKWSSNPGNGSKCKSRTCRASECFLCFYVQNLIQFPLAESRIMKDNIISIDRIVPGVHTVCRSGSDR